MVTLFKPKPQFFKYVDRPTNASSKELAAARPVYIDGLPSGEAGTVTVADVQGLQSIIDDLTSRIEALEGE